MNYYIFSFIIYCFIIISISGCDGISEKDLSGAGTETVVDSNAADNNNSGSVNPEAVNSGNNYPVVLLHGFMGWGREEMGHHYYWGGYDDLQEILKSSGHDCYTASVGPFSSNWDRACELYAQLKGARVDYGLAHSAKSGHARFGRDYTGRALISSWGRSGINQKIHIIAHSQGGVTARMFAELLEQGSRDELAADYSGKEPVSPLFSGSNETKKIICSITTITAIHNGGTSMLGLEILAPGTFAKMLISMMEILGIDTTGTIGTIYDFKLDQFGITPRQKGEKLKAYFARMNRAISTFLNEKQKDISFWDASPDGAGIQNAWVHAQENIYYFSFAARDSHPSKSSLLRDNWEYYHVPNADMIPLFDLFSFTAGSYTCNDDRYNGLLAARNDDFFGLSPDQRVVIDSSWWPNDGMANTITQKGPWVYPAGYNGIKDVIVDWDGSSIPEKGEWNYYGVLEGFDHFDVVGFELLPSQKDIHPENIINHMEDWYIEMVDYLKLLPR